MDESAFRAALVRDGYEVREVEWAASHDPAEHSHPFDARLLCVAGAVTLQTAAGTCTYGPGDTFDVPAGTPHREKAGAGGARLVVGRRAPA